MDIDGFVKVLEALTKFLGVLIWPAILAYILVRFGPALKEFFLSLGELSLKDAGFEATAKRKQEAASALVAAAVARPNAATTSESAARDAKEANEIVAESVNKRLIRRASDSTVPNNRMKTDARSSHRLCDALGGTENAGASPRSSSALAAHQRCCKGRFRALRAVREAVPRTRRTAMSPATRERYLPYALRVIALIAVLGFYPLTVFWPSGWAWHTGHRSEYLEMIIAIYATLGVFLWLAARNPPVHRTLISFTVWSSVVHALVMAAQAILNPAHVHHLYGDVPALLLVAGTLAYLYPAAISPTARSAA